MSRLNDTRAIVDIPLKQQGYCGDVCPSGQKAHSHSLERGVNPTKPLRTKSGERDTYPANPDAGGAVTARRGLAGSKQYSYDWESGDTVDVTRVSPDAGLEGLSNATRYLRGGSNTKMPRKG